MNAIELLKTIEEDHRFATPEEQKVLSQYVGWGGLPQAFDAENEQWKAEYDELKAALTDEESLAKILKRDKEQFVVPRTVQDVIPAKRIWTDGIWLVGNKYSKCWKFSDINYATASRSDKKAMFLSYEDLLNSLDSSATTKITISNKRMNKQEFEEDDSLRGLLIRIATALPDFMG